MVTSGENRPGPNKNVMSATLHEQVDHDDTLVVRLEKQSKSLCTKLGIRPILLIIAIILGLSMLFSALSHRRRSFLSLAAPSDDQDELAQRDAAFMKRITADSLLTSAVKVQWSEVVGQEEAKEALRRSVVWPMENPGLFEGLRAPAPAVLLYGPPGTGKTMLAKAVATTLADHKVAFFNVTASTFAAKYHGDGERLVRCLFKVARESKKAVIFIDEIDALLSSRFQSGGDDDAMRRLKTEFLVNLDGLLNDQSMEGRVILIAATNMPHLLDPAFLRRCGRRVSVSLPNHQARLLQLQLLLKKCEKQNITSSQLEWFAKDQLKGYSGSDVTAVVREAAMVALDGAVEKGLDISQITVSDIPAMTVEHLQTARTRVKPSLSPGYMKEIEQWERSIV